MACHYVNTVLFNGEARSILTVVLYTREFDLKCFKFQTHFGDDRNHNVPRRCICQMSSFPWHTLSLRRVLAGPIPQLLMPPGEEKSH